MTNLWEVAGLHGKLPRIYAQTYVYFVLPCFCSFFLPYFLFSSFADSCCSPFAMPFIRWELPRTWKDVI